MSSIRRRRVANGSGAAWRMASLSVGTPAIGLGASAAIVISSRSRQPASSQAAFAIDAIGNSAVPSNASKAFASLSFR